MNAATGTLRRAAAIVSAAMIAGGIVFFGWSTFTVLGLYWLENVVIGGFVALRLLAAGARSERYAESLASMLFFTVHYGMFCLVHGFFIAALFGELRNLDGLVEPVLLMVLRIAGDAIGLLVVAAMVAAAAFDAWQAIGDVEADDERAIGRIMFEPYGRIVVLHLALIGGGFVMQTLQWPPLAALLLVAGKLVYDLRDRRGPRPASGGAAAAERREPAA